MNNLRMLIHHFVEVFRFMVCWLLLVFGIVFVTGVLSFLMWGVFT